jgi:hypothetical protein
MKTNKRNGMPSKVRVEIGGFSVRINQNGRAFGAASTLIVLAAKGLVRRESDVEFYVPADVLASAFGLD